LETLFRPGVSYSFPGERDFSSGLPPKFDVIFVKKTKINGLFRNILQELREKIIQNDERRNIPLHPFITIIIIIAPKPPKLIK